MKRTKSCECSHESLRLFSHRGGEVVNECVYIHHKVILKLVLFLVKKILVDN